MRNRPRAEGECPTLKKPPDATSPVAPRPIPGHVISFPAMPPSFPRCFVLVLLLAARGVTASPLPLAAEQQRATELLDTILAAAGPAENAGPKLDVAHSSLGVNLADYANNPGTDPAQFETTIDAARRILVDGTTSRRSPDATSLWLDATAAHLLAAVRAAEIAPGSVRDAAQAAALVDVRARALLGRYHARRLLAAVHYNLFKRGQRLAELVAAAFGERDAVVVWRELVATCGSHPLAPLWRAELKKLEWSLKELEDQCCPPDEATLREKIWQPATRLVAR